MTDAWGRLIERVRELEHVATAVKLLEWDQQVLMPPKGAPARASTIATIEAMAHERLTDPALGELLEELRDDDSLDEDQAASVRVLARDHEQARKLPEDLVRALAEARGHAYQAWVEARPADDFGILQPHLTKLLALKKQEADALGWTHERYDALLDQFEPGMVTSEVVDMFADLVAGIKPVADKVLERSVETPEYLLAHYDTDKQTAFCAWLAERLGFDFEQGRLDTSPHPFTIKISRGDIRQTTRAEANALLSSIYAAVHETGHALYEQGIPPPMADLPVGRYPSLGMHESQSRLWENQVARGRPFTDFLLPHLKEQFPEALGMTSPEDFYRGVNHVGRTLIRVTADELTYNLHVALRFELEIAMFRDELDVADLPDAWDDAMEKHVGIRPEDQADGVLQDMHWSIGALGYFPTYTLGNIYSAAFYEKAAEDMPDLEQDLRRGESGDLLAWLREKVHSQGYRYEATDLARRVVGRDVDSRPLVAYLTEKYSALYS